MTALASDPFGAAHLVGKLVDEEAFYYSRWDGTDWTTPLDIIATTGNVALQSPALVAAADGSLHLFWAQNYVMHSWAWVEDAASSARAWSVPEAIIVPNESARDAMDAKQDRSGAFHLVYAAGNDVYYVHSDSEGLNWTEPAAVRRAGDATRMSAPRLDLGPNGRIHVTWEEWPVNGDPAQSSQLYYAHSTNGGMDWSEPRQLGDMANRGSNVLAANDGTVYLAWQAGLNSPNEGRFVQRSTDGGNTWEGPLSFSRGRGQTGYPSMALDAAGTLHIMTADGEYAVWEGRSISTALDLKPRPEQTENARLTIVNGNQVLVVMSPFWSPGLYYAVRQLPLSALPTVTLPAREQTLATPVPTTGVERAASTDVATAAVAIQNTRAVPQDSAAPSTVSVLAFSALLSLALVVGVLIARFRPRHH